mmetsp:Transcript_242/g.820  ORF Transcript_242/g.820 Transcript_242/m.820 type:complete len:275 (-) Transcript_242:1390-2214(-)
MYSLISILTIASSLSNNHSARDFANCVFPTPVGPRKSRDAIGRFGSDRPKRDRCTASATARTASSWPTTDLWSSPSKLISRCLSPKVIRSNGMPVCIATTCCMSNSVTSSTAPDELLSSISWSSFCNGIREPHLMVPAFSKSYPLSASASSCSNASICCLTSCRAFSDSLCVFQTSSIPACSAFKASSSFSRSSRRLCELLSESFATLSLSISNCKILLSKRSRSAGLDVTCIFTFAAASSSRSIALSGRNLSATYRLLSIAAAMQALSEIRTP